MTERDRRSRLRRRPIITSWRDLLETARAARQRPAGPDRTVDWRRTG